MSRADFTLTYDGPALANHEMDVRDLAPAMLAVGELFDALNSLLNGDGVEIAVNVRVHEPGCFSVVFEVLQNWKDGALALLSGDAITAAINLRDLILASGAGLVWLIKKTKGRTLDKVETASPGMARITIGEEAFEVPLALLRAYQELTVRSALERVVAKPLAQTGIDEVRFEARGRSEVVRASEIDWFRVPEVSETILVDDTREAAYSIISLAFKEENKWRLHDGSNSVSALIEDEDFLRRVDANAVRFAKGDVLVCDVRFMQRQTAKGLVTEHRVVKVKRHIPAPRQLPLLPETRDEGESNS